MYVHILAYTVHWVKGTAQGMVMAVFGAAAAFGTSLFLCSFLTGIVLMLATPASTRAQATEDRKKILCVDIGQAALGALALGALEERDGKHACSHEVSQGYTPQHSVCILPGSGQAERGQKGSGATVGTITFVPRW
jgi:hypothetical protein